MSGYTDNLSFGVCPEFGCVSGDLSFGCFATGFCGCDVGGALEQFGFVEDGAGTDEGDQVRGVDGAPTSLCGVDLERRGPSSSLLSYLLEGRVQTMVAGTSTAEAILACARSAIVVGGYNGFSYADIAAVVGIRKASIHHHFPTKVELVRVLVERYRAETQAGIAEIERHVADPLEQLRAYTGYWEACIGNVESSFCLCALLATQIPVLPDEIVFELRAHFRALSAWLTSVLERGARQGGITLTSSARSEAEALMAVIHGAMLSARAYGDPQVFGAIVHPAIDGLRSRPPTSEVAHQPPSR